MHFPIGLLPPVHPPRAGTHNLDSFFGFDEKSSEGEEEVRVLDLPEHARSGIRSNGVEGEGGGSWEDLQS